MNFNEIYALHFRDVYRFMLALCKDQTLAEEITQETFVRAMDNFSSFKGNCKVNTWLCQIAKNLYFNILDKNKKIDYNSDTEGMVYDDLADRLADSVDSEKIHRMLHSLPEPYKEVFTLRVFAELPYAQIADLFGKHENWARVTYYRAKQKITGRLEDLS